MILVLVCSCRCQDRQSVADRYERELRILFDDPRMRAIISYEVEQVEKQGQAER
jgi:hypothetical protein